MGSFKTRILKCKGIHDTWNSWFNCRLVRRCFFKKIILKKNAIVSGATGGVGSIAVKLLSTLVKRNCNYWQRGLSCFSQKAWSKINNKRKVFLDSSNSPLGKRYWDFALDVAGGKTLSKILKGMNYGGIITCCGLVDNPKFESTVYPFILRANQLIGIDSLKRL